MTDYWKNREIKAREALLDKTIDELNSLMKAEYLRISKKLIDQLTTIYGIILGEGATPLASHLYQYNRYYELLNRVESELQKLGVKQNSLMTKTLVDYYKQNSKVVGESFSLNTEFNTHKVEQAVKRAWVNDGQNYSSRIWTDKRKLAEKLKETVADAVVTGKNPDKLVEELMKDFGSSYSNTKRLVVTELAHVQVLSTIDTYKQNGVKEYIYLAELDDRTCETCRELDGKVFPIDDKEHLPPLHPNSRSTVKAKI